MLIFLDTGKGACLGGVALLILPTELERDLALLYYILVILYTLPLGHIVPCS